MRIKSLSLLVALAACAAAATQAATVSAGSLSASAKTIVGPKTVPSLSVAIVTHGEIAVLDSFGQATPRTAYWIGSATKTLTATSIMQLVQQNRISLDDSLAKYYPAQTQWADVTIRNLLEHTSGIPNYLDEAVLHRLVLKPTTPQAIVSSAAMQTLRFKPGSDWSYSNTNYVLLGQIVEKISGMSLAQYEQQHIFNIAGMAHTAVGKAPAGVALAPPFVTGRAAKVLGSTPGDPSWLGNPAAHTDNERLDAGENRPIAVYSYGERGDYAGHAERSARAVRTNRVLKEDCKCFSI